MKTHRPPLAAALVFAFAFAAAPAAAVPSLTQDFGGMSQWLSHEMAQGLAFNAGETFDPPREVKGYYLQPDVSLGVGRFPFDKRDFPTLTTPALVDYGGANLFPSETLFPNFTLHLRMGLPWRGDVYFRLADATTPSNYKISPTMTAKVQTNSYGGGIRQHLFGGDWPVLTLGAHYNHVQGSTHLKGMFNVNTNGFTADSPFLGDIEWSINSFGLTAIVSETFDSWTPFAGVGYNYVTGSVRTKLDLQSSTFLIPDIVGEGSDQPEQNQGRVLCGLSYDHPTWSLFGNAELKAIGQLPYRSWIVQIGGALPFDIGRGPAIIYKRRPATASAPKRSADDDSTPAPQPRPRRREPQPQPEQSPSGLIFLK